MSSMSDWKLGERYSYYSKETCFREAQEAKSFGYDVRFGVNKNSGCRKYYFEIIDPFEGHEGW